MEKHPGDYCRGLIRVVMQPKILYNITYANSDYELAARIFMV